MQQSPDYPWIVQNVYTDNIQIHSDNLGYAVHYRSFNSIEIIQLIQFAGWLQTIKTSVPWWCSVECSRVMVVEKKLALSLLVLVRMSLYLLLDGRRLKSLGMELEDDRHVLWWRCSVDGIWDVHQWCFGRFSPGLFLLDTMELQIHTVMWRSWSGCSQWSILLTWFCLSIYSEYFLPSFHTDLFFLIDSYLLYFPSTACIPDVCIRDSS